MSQELNIITVPLNDVQMVEAAAGTGKTYNITALVIRQIVEKGLNIDQILVVTFTNAATRELKDRISKRIREFLAVIKGERDADASDSFLTTYSTEYLKKAKKSEAIERLEKAIRDMDLATIYTIHGFCQQLLQEFVFESNSRFDVEFTDDDSELRQEVLDEVWHSYIRKFYKDDTLRVLIPYLAAKGNPDSHEKELKTILSKPYAKLWDEPKQTDLADLVSKAEHHLNTARKKYDADLISEVLERAKLNGNSYKKDAYDSFKSMLRDFALSEDFTIDPESVFSNIQKFTLTELKAKQSKKSTYEIAPDFFEDLELYLDACTSIRNVFHFTFLKDAVEKYHSKKKSLKVQTYDDILINVEAALKQESGEKLAKKLRAKFPAAMIDEFQDTDPVQFSIFEKIYIEESRENLSLFLIGDPKQSIYKFRGADIHTYLKARKQAQNTWTLKTNYRSADDLVQGINALFISKNQEKPFYQEIAFQPAEANKKENDLTISTKLIESEPLQFLCNDYDLKSDKNTARSISSENIAKEVTRLLHAGNRGEVKIEDHNLQAKDIAILVRSKKEGQSIREKLSDYGVKASVQSTGKVFESDEYDDLVLLISAIKNPSQTGIIKALLCTRMTGFHISELQKLEENETLWLDLLDHLRNLHQLYKKRGFMPVFRRFLNTPIFISDSQSITPIQSVVSYKDGERCYTNLHHLAELINSYGRTGKRTPDDILKWLALQKKESSDKDSYQMRLESDENLVKIMTIHASKGLQFPVVFCEGLWSSNTQDKPFVWTDKDNGQAWIDVIGKESSKELDNDEAYAENLRLLYVAVTRAEYRCYISFQPYLVRNSKKPFQKSPISAVLAGTDVFDDKWKFDEVIYKDAITNLSAQTHTGVSDDNREIVSRLEPAEKKADDKPLQERKFTRGKVNSSWFSTSYSGISRQKLDSLDDEDGDGKLGEFENVTSDTDSSDSAGKNIYGFPKGATPGNLMHQIFEDIDFTWPEKKQQEIITKLLKEYNYTQAWHETAIRKMVSHTLQKKLKDELSLANISADKCLKEMEFYFPVMHARFTELMEVITGKSVSGSEEKLRGFMKGFIDLIFEYEGKYYILDYKSNHLGNAATDYHPDILEQKMKAETYDLQYHIYTVALKRYLQKRLSDFDYDQHFGGVFYVFLRADQEEYGVFYDRPEEKIITELDRYFQGKI